MKYWQKNENLNSKSDLETQFKFQNCKSLRKKSEISPENENLDSKN